MLSVAIVVVSYGSYQFLPTCLRTLFENTATYPQARVVLVENKQDEQARKETQQVAQPFLARGLQLLLARENLGYGGGANLGWQQLGGEADVYIVLNPDMEFPADWLRQFIAPFEQDAAIGIVGCKLRNADGTIQHAGGLLRHGLALGLHFGYGEPDDGRWNESCEVEFVTGAALGLRRQAYEELGGFDPAYFPGYYEDVDLCWRARAAGYKVWYEAGAIAYHYEGGTFGREARYYLPLHRNRLRFVLKYFSTSALLSEFLPSERARLQGTLADLDRRASAAVYRAAARSFEAALEKTRQGEPMAGINKEKSRQAKQKGAKAFEDVFSSYDTGLESLDTQEAALAARLSGHMREVKERWLVEEKPFRSKLPLVATLRERFNSISTRWYVKPILAQQVEFNGAVSRSIEDLGKLTLGNVAAEQLQTATLSARLLALESRLERIEALLEKLADEKALTLSRKPLED